MDYIEELKKIKTEISSIETTHPKAPLYKLLAYREALDNFVEKEYKKYCYEVVGTTGYEIDNLPSIKVNENLKLRAMLDFSKLDYENRKKCIILSKNFQKNKNKIKALGQKLII